MFIFRSDILSLLRTYNCYHEGKNFQLRTREVRKGLPQQDHLTGDSAGRNKKINRERYCLLVVCVSVLDYWTYSIVKWVAHISNWNQLNQHFVSWAENEDNKHETK